MFITRFLIWFWDFFFYYFLKINKSEKKDCITLILFFKIVHLTVLYKLPNLLYHFQSLCIIRIYATHIWLLYRWIFLLFIRKPLLGYRLVDKLQEDQRRKSFHTPQVQWFSFHFPVWRRQTVKWGPLIRLNRHLIGIKSAIYCSVITLKNRMFPGVFKGKIWRFNYEPLFATHLRY